MNREYLLTYEKEIEILGLGVSQGTIKTYEWFEDEEEMNDFIEENDVYIPKFDTIDRITMLGEFHLNMPNIEAVNLTNANLMITHLLNLVYLDKQEELVQCIDVYIKKLKNNEGSIDKISFFNEIDNMIKSNISEMNDKYINKTALIRQNDSLRYIKELVLNKGEK
ncbi:hypothetical protein EJM73_08950 [Clostridium botulinum]|uniref:hypothetical protein n=1 Tax=Clostridium botulinum TaxID=1491 RepID=UPI001375467A|nr:hypothetical protein [Clostridium botulinum]NCI19752.1 hypothetical protein [Clostridium botulinum]NCI35790.1 hypothetical protein [Clostridium botulinum]NCI71647.1 hypothetical protein [Clostridium botulinum]NDI38839.1 hypothetical protein [Clostridium botulinum]